MSQVLKDIEEALKREITAITTHYNTTKTNKTIQTTFDPFTGKAKEVPIQANFYNENSIPNHVNYPRVDITYDRISEDKESGRMISIWEDRQTDYRILISPNQDRPRVYEAVVSGREGVIEGSYITLDRFKFNKINSNYLIKIITGNNKATYKISSLDGVNSRIEVSPNLVENIQEVSFNENTRKLYILNPIDLYSVNAGDYFVDSLGSQFKINSIDIKQREIYLGGQDTPNLGLDSRIIRTRNVFRNTDPVEVSYIVMDPTKPKVSINGEFEYVTDKWLLEHPATPFNYYYSIEIKNKERPVHIAVAERMTETVINRPRRALDILLRNNESVESEILDRPMNSRQIKVKDSSKYKVNDSVYLINCYRISENNQIIDIDYSSDTITLRENISNEYNFKNESYLVAKATLKIWGFFIEDEPIMAEDPQNNFYRQEYSFRVEGWKSEKSGITEVGGITSIEGTIESTNKVEEDFEV